MLRLKQKKQSNLLYKVPNKPNKLSVKRLHSYLKKQNKKLRNLWELMLNLRLNQPRKT